MPAYSLQWAGIYFTPSSPVPEGKIHDSLLSIKQVFTQIEERNKRIRENIEPQSEAQIPPKKKILLIAMELEKDELRISFSHPSSMNVTSTTSFKFVT